MLDISDIAATPRTIEILHPKTDEPTGVFVTLLPKDDARVKAETRRIADVNLVLRQKGKMITQAQLERNAISLLKAAIAGWDWSENSTIGFHGERPAYSANMAEQVLTECPWFRDQLDEALGDEKAFFQN